MTTEEYKQLFPPEEPGVYIMKDKLDKIIYVGKAISIKKRLASYFRSIDKLDPKTKVLVSKIQSIEFMVTDSEVEALMLEYNLIKKHRPRYNIVMRDDKSYPYLKVTVQEAYPRVMVTRKPFVDKAKYFGPYVGIPLKEVARQLSLAFELCVSKTALDPAKPKKRPCLYYQMKQCSGACLGIIPVEDYRKNVKALIKYLEGGKEKFSRKIKEKMALAADQQEYELAGQFRDQLDALKRVQKQPTVRSSERDNKDVIALARSGTSATVEIFTIRLGNLEGRRHFFLQHVGVSTSRELYSQVLTQYYTQPVTIPDEIILPALPSDQPLIETWLSTKYEGPVTIRLTQTDEEKRLMHMADANAWLYLKRNAEVFSDELTEIDEKNLKDIQKQLRLAQLPLKIECYDISNISGQDPVGSKVTMTNGQLDKNQYRRYKIKSIEGPNDFAMMQEMLFRRLKRMKDEEETPPDLLVVDGGAGQLSAGQAVLKELELGYIPMIGLAKKEEEIYLPGQREPLKLSKTLPIIRLLTRLRDEAHRFAITYHRKIRGKRMHVSVLDKVEGLGDQKRRELLRVFGSVDALLEISEEELSQMPGIGNKMAKRIQQVLRRH